MYWVPAFQKFFLFWMPMNIQKDWKVKLESAYSFMLKCSKITVCIAYKIKPKFDDIFFVDLRILYVFCTSCEREIVKKFDPFVFCQVFNTT